MKAGHLMKQQLDNVDPLRSDGYQERVPDISFAYLSRRWSLGCVSIINPQAHLLIKAFNIGDVNDGKLPNEAHELLLIPRVARLQKLSLVFLIQCSSICLRNGLL